MTVKFVPRDRLLPGVATTVWGMILGGGEHVMEAIVVMHHCKLFS